MRTRAAEVESSHYSVLATVLDFVQGFKQGPTRHTSSHFVDFYQIRRSSLFQPPEDVRNRAPERLSHVSPASCQSMSRTAHHYPKRVGTVVAGGSMEC
jgi:hypothetical protein